MREPLAKALPEPGRRNAAKEERERILAVLFGDDEAPAECRASVQVVLDERQKLERR